MQAPEIDVVLSTGETTPFRQLYSEHGAVLIFLRHLGCTFCREQVAHLQFASELNAVFVCMADPAEAEAFRKQRRSPHPFICDPAKTLYELFGLGKADLPQLFGPKVFSRGFGATLRGHWIGMPIGDPWQMPGIFSIDSGGEIIWEYRSADAADNLTLAQIRLRETTK